MKKTSKLLILFAVLALLISTVCLPLSAASVTKYYLKVEAGQSGYGKDVVLSNDANVVGIEGTIKISNLAMLKGITVDDSFGNSYAAVSDTLNRVGEAEFQLFSLNHAINSARLGLYFNLAINRYAVPGDDCTITIEYNLFDANGEQLNLEPLVLKLELEVKISETVVDLTQLEAAIADAETLVERNHSLESWNRLQVALKNAKVALGYNLQSSINEATDALIEATAYARANTLNYEALEEVIKEAEDLNLEGSFVPGSNLIVAFANALTEAKNVNVRAATQTAIDDAAANLRSALDALIEAAFTTESEDTTTEHVCPTDTSVSVSVSESVSVSVSVSVSESVSVSVSESVSVSVSVSEVPGETVEVEPDDFCSKGMHKVWLILFIVFAVIAVILATLLIIKEVKKGKQQKDETPETTDYDISDDDADEVAEETAEEEVSEEASEEADEDAE